MNQPGFLHSLLPMKIERLQTKDIPTMWRINEEGLPGVGKVSMERLTDLLSLCDFPLGAHHGGELVGFVLCLSPGTRYDSLNYAWFNERYDKFVYVDRIAVGKSQRDLKIGSQLYAKVIQHANKRAWPVAAEVNLEPPNPGSMRFHSRHHFKQVGVLDHENTSVAMLMRDCEATSHSE